jgi:hypothetical protein
MVTQKTIAHKRVFLLVLGISVLASVPVSAFVSNVELQSYTAIITEKSHLKPICPGDSFSTPWHDGMLPTHLDGADRCDLDIEWAPAFDLITKCNQPPPIVQNGVTIPAPNPGQCILSIKPEKILIREIGALPSSEPVFAQALPQSQNMWQETIHADAWYRADRFSIGKSYGVFISYDIRDSDPADTTPPPTDEQRIFSFTPTKSRWTGQVTAKLFTAWQPESDGDRSFIMPGISIGVARRLADNYNDQDIVALRLVLAAGPNLVPTAQVTTNAAGMITGVTTPQHLQFLTGAELVLGRYASVGLVWIPFGSDSSHVPLILLSYGELYPAVASTN